MQRYVEDATIELNVPFRDGDGAAITPTALRAKLYDGEDALLEDMGTIAVTGTTEQAVSVHQTYNQLGDDEVRAVRVLRVELDHAGGTARRTIAYALEREQGLELMLNSFQTYENAELLAADFVSLEGWSLATEERRRAALVNAFQRLTRLPMRYWLRNEKGQRVEPDYIIYRDLWPTITAEMFRAFPRYFRQALRTAQLVEANELLQGDTIGRKQRQGVISETVGESSMTLKSGVVDLGISSEALKILAGHIHFSMSIARG